MSKQVARFRRYEHKFWTDRRTMRDFLSYLLNFMDFDEHGDEDHSYWITSLYLETHDLMTYAEKYNGDLERRKYRIRFYNDDPSLVFFEVKKKYNAFIDKSRTPFAIPDGDFSKVEAALQSRDSEVNDEFMQAYHEYALAPMAWVAYRRIALVGKNNPALRVTFDMQVSGTSAWGFRPRYEDVRNINLSRWKDPVILEIKFTQQYPLWLEIAMRDLGFIHESISKYGMVMARYYFNEKREQWIH
ncbi:MAG: VTC domain-containing protein [Candidatus Sumerlaeia bacterium]